MIFTEHMATLPLPKHTHLLHFEKSDPPKIRQTSIQALNSATFSKGKNVRNICLRPGLLFPLYLGRRTRCGSRRAAAGRARARALAGLSCPSRWA